MKDFLITTAAALGLLAAAPALAETATAMTELELRTGPGMDYAVVATAPARGSVEVEGCLEVGTWCRVRHEGEAYWADRSRLSASPAIKTPVRAATISRHGPVENDGVDIAPEVITGNAALRPEPIDLEIPDAAISLFISREQAQALPLPTHGERPPVAGQALPLTLTSLAFDRLATGMATAPDAARAFRR